MKFTSLPKLIIFSLITFFFFSCEKSENRIPANIEIQDFVWKGMNAFYLWQGEVADLADTRFSSQAQLNSFLQDFSDPVNLFHHLRFQPGTVDRFSVIVDDYVALENLFQGINTSNGMEFGLTRFADGSENVFAYVRYVIPNSDAATKNVTRGMLFTHVNATQLTENNYRALLFSDNTNYTITLADFNNGNPIANGTDIELSKTQLQENPIAIAKVFDEGVDKIGYLMYNQFASSFDQQLNAVFANFKSEGITDLIVDLRYNGGGRTSSALFLAGMITGQFDGQLFYKELWNNKVQNSPDIDQNIFINNFTNQLNNGTVNEAINNLNLTRAYFITTISTASASELVMNGLDPYIDVFSVGTTTTGKVHGSITIYDSDNFSRRGSNLNPNHTWAIQPLTFETRNSNDFRAPSGIIPTVELREDFGNLGVLGEKSDPLLDRAISLILTGNKSPIKLSTPILLEEIGNSKSNTLLGNNMYKELKN